jgi:hypothetical protein
MCRAGKAERRGHGLILSALLPANQAAGFATAGRGRCLWRPASALDHRVHRVGPRELHLARGYGVAMNSFLIGFITLTCSFSAAVAGLALHTKLPRSHLDGDSRDVVKLVMGLIATVAALVLGLLIASAQNSYNNRNSNLQKVGAELFQLDHLLAMYGPEAKDARELLRKLVAIEHDRIWSPSGLQAQNLAPGNIQTEADKFFSAIQSLSPRNDAQRFARDQILQTSTGIGQTRMLMFEQTGDSVASPFLLILVFWICVLFLGFGLFARFHGTIVVALLVGSISVSAAIFLILELGNPYSGIIQLSDQPILSVYPQIHQSSQQ